MDKISWPRFVREYFEEQECGTISDIKKWVEDNKIHLFINKLQRTISRQNLERLYPSELFLVKAAEKKIRYSQALSPLLRKMANEGILDKIRVGDGKSEYLYSLAYNPKSSKNCDKIIN